MGSLSYYRQQSIHWPNMFFSYGHLSRLPPNNLGFVSCNLMVIGHLIGYSPPDIYHIIDSRILGSSSLVHIHSDPSLIDDATPYNDLTKFLEMVPF